MMSIPTCRHCNVALGQQAEKALSGEVQMVWANVLDDDWVCPVTGDEHCPAHLPCEHPVTTPAIAGAFIVVESHPVDGYVYHGIPAFPDYKTASTWGQENCTHEWWVAPLQDVE